MDMSLSKLQEIGKDREAWCTAVHEITKSLHDLAQLNNNNNFTDEKTGDLELL